MIHLPRRSLLKAGGAAALLGFGALAGRPRPALGFGEVPRGSEDTLLPVDRRVDSVLEVFLFGGVSQYESFFAVEEFGAGGDAPTQWHAFLQSGDLQAALDLCELGSSELLLPFGEDGEGHLVHLGPLAQPLRARPDLLERLRVVVTSHDAEPHEVAIPLALTGRRPGDPSLAGLGAHVQRFHVGSATDAFVPSSYVLGPPSAVQLELMQAASATGLHSGNVRPFELRMGASTRLLDLLQRPTVGEARAEVDALLDLHLRQYRAAVGEVRARALSDATAVGAAMSNVTQSARLLEAQYFDALPGESCGVSTPVDATRMSLRLAAHMLSDPETPARYVLVVDGGFGNQVGAGGYDTHTDTPRTQARNLTNCLRGLVDVINKPGEADPRKIDLDRTMVVINTEFGRTPDVQGVRGRGHWPASYPALVLGGPVRKDNAGVLGAVGPDARATDAVGPVTHRVAALAAMGIWPFSSDSYNVSDVPGLASEAEVMEWITTRYFGVAR